AEDKIAGSNFEQRLRWPRRGEPQGWGSYSAQRRFSCRKPGGAGGGGDWPPLARSVRPASEPYSEVSKSATYHHHPDHHPHQSATCRIQKMITRSLRHSSQNPRSPFACLIGIRYMTSHIK